MNAHFYVNELVSKVLSFFKNLYTKSYFMYASKDYTMPHFIMQVDVFIIKLILTKRSWSDFQDIVGLPHLSVKEPLQTNAL